MMWHSLIFMTLLLSLELVLSYELDNTHCTRKLLQEHFIDDDFVFEVMIDKNYENRPEVEWEFDYEDNHFYAMKVMESYKNKSEKLLKNNKIFLYTPKPIRANRYTAVHFAPGKSYIISGQRKNGNYFMDACNYHSETKSLSKIQRGLLKKRAYRFNVDCQIKKQKGDNTKKHCFYTDDKFGKLDKYSLCAPDKKDICTWVSFNRHIKKNSRKIKKII